MTSRPGVVGREAELARVRVVERRLDRDAGAAHQRHHLVEDAPLGQRQNQRLVRAHDDHLPEMCRSNGPLRLSTGCRGCQRVGQGSPRSSRWHRMRSTSSRIAAPPAKSSWSAPAPRRGSPAGPGCARESRGTEAAPPHRGDAVDAEAGNGALEIVARPPASGSQRKRFATSDEAPLLRQIGHLAHRDQRVLQDRRRARRDLPRPRRAASAPAAMARAQPSPGSRSMSAPQAASFSSSRS